MKLYQASNERYTNGKINYIAIDVNVNRRNQALIVNVVRRLERMGGQVIRDTGNGSVYVGMSNAKIVRVSDHEIKSRNGVTAPIGGADREILVNSYDCF